MTQEADQKLKGAKLKLIVGWGAYPIIGWVAGSKLGGDLGTAETWIIISMLIAIPVVFMIPVTVAYFIVKRRVDQC